MSGNADFLVSPDSAELGVSKKKKNKKQSSGKAGQVFVIKYSKCHKKNIYVCTTNKKKKIK